MHVIKILACVILSQNETWKILQSRNVVCQGKILAKSENSRGYIIR